MDSIQYEALRRMFLEKRLAPWEFDHAMFIKGELARLKATEPHDFESYSQFYEQKLADYEVSLVPNTGEVSTEHGLVPAAPFNNLPLPVVPSVTHEHGELADVPAEVSGVETPELPIVKAAKKRGPKSKK